MLEIVKFALILIGCIIFGDLLSPLATYLFYKTVNILGALLITLPFLRSMSYQIPHYTSDDISHIYPPKTIQYLRQYWHMHHRKQTIKPSHMVKELKQAHDTILAENALNMVECPVIEPCDDDLAKSPHVKRIISKPKEGSNHE